MLSLSKLGRTFPVVVLHGLRTRFQVAEGESDDRHRGGAPPPCARPRHACRGGTGLGHLLAGQQGAAGPHAAAVVAGPAQRRFRHGAVSPCVRDNGPQRAQAAGRAGAVQHRAAAHDWIRGAGHACPAVRAGRTFDRARLHQRPMGAAPGGPVPRRARIAAARHRPGAGHSRPHGDLQSAHLRLEQRPRRLRQRGAAAGRAAVGHQHRAQSRPYLARRRSSWRRGRRCSQP
jgi:hypothetical protein